MTGSSSTNPRFRENLVTMTKDVERRCMLVESAHFNVAGRWENINLGLGILAISVGIVAGGTGALNLGPVAGYFAILSGMLAAVIAFLKPGDHGSAHKRAGDKWSGVRDRSAVIHELSEQLSGRTDDELMKEYDALL